MTSPQAPDLALFLVKTDIDQLNNICRALHQSSEGFEVVIDEALSSHYQLERKACAKSVQRQQR